ncbi:zf-HC2 domain-containing protein [Amphibacillus sp. Q70]|uniref:zf-HC2 domain-containing protein n=1 Tax=Amphibacillus sp. Q70 TaxID=3453416 RepID=UPI003F845E0D
MKVTCDVIRDLLPLYVEKMTSDDTCAMIEEHLASCEDCRNYLKELETADKIPIDTDVTPFLKIKSTLQKKKIQAVIVSFLVLIVLVIFSISLMSAPKYRAYDEDIVTLNETDNGMLIASFDEKIGGYEMNRSLTEDNSGYVYHLTTYDSLYHVILRDGLVNRQTKETDIILNPDGEQVAAVYYYQTGKTADILIYGEDIAESGGVVTLPRLYLAYYRSIALLLSFICGVILKFFWKNRKVRHVTMKLFFLPVSFLLAQLIVSGLISVSYHSTRDFVIILSTMVPLYLIFLIIYHQISKAKEKTTSPF